MTNAWRVAVSQIEDSVIEEGGRGLAVQQCQSSVKEKAAEI